MCFFLSEGEIFVGGDPFCFPFSILMGLYAEKVLKVIVYEWILGALSNVFRVNFI